MKKSFFFIINFFLCISLSAQEKLSLAQAIEIGIQNNYQIEIAKQNLQVANNNNDWGAAGRYPRLDFNINSINTFVKLNIPF